VTVTRHGRSGLQIRRECRLVPRRAPSRGQSRAQEANDGQAATEAWHHSDHFHLGICQVAYVGTAGFEPATSACKNRPWRRPRGVTIPARTRVGVRGVRPRAGSLLSRWLSYPGIHVPTDARTLMRCTDSNRLTVQVAQRGLTPAFSGTSGATWERRRSDR
jgi:hypothetical protein